MTLTPITLPRQSNPGRFGADGATRLINCFCEDRGEEGKARFPIYANPGWDVYASLSGQGAIRNGIELDGAVYVVAGDQVVKITGSSQTVIGTVGGPDLTKTVTMARNRAAVPQIGIVVDGFYYLVEDDVLTEVTDADLEPDVNSIAHLDGYFVLLCDSGKFQLTSIDDGSTIAALDFANASADPDGGAMVAVRNRDLVLFGPNSVEFWQDTGGTFPFTRTTSAAGSYAGLLAPKSVATVGETLAYVASDRTVRLLNGYTPQRISNHAVERSIEAETDPTQITGLAWTYNGHTRYEISGTGFTWIYDTGLSTWTEARSYGLSRSRASVYVFYDGRHLFGDYETGKIYDRSNNHLSEAGQPIIWQVQIAPVHAFPRQLRINALEIDVMTGAALDPVTEPQLMLDWSDDGGKTFGTQRMMSLGKQGNRRKRVTVYQLGLVPRQGRTFRLSGSAESATCVLEVQPDLEALKVRGN